MRARRETRASGTSTRAKGTSPPQTGTNPRTVKSRQAERERTKSIRTVACHYCGQGRLLWHERRLYAADVSGVAPDLRFAHQCPGRRYEPVQPSRRPSPWKRRFKRS
jgi:hypothetical protein